MQNLCKKTMKHRIFLGPSILEAFREDLGRVLGARNPRFSHFFGWVFETSFEARFGRENNRPKWPHGRRKRIFGAAIRSSQGSWGEKKRGESRTLWPELFRQVLWGQDFADRTRDEASISSTPLPHLRWAADCKPPRGGDHRRPLLPKP